jgi:hypothetical protein
MWMEEWNYKYRTNGPVLSEPTLSMLTILAMIGLTVALGVFWFRYTCALILSAKPAKDYRLQVIQANQLKFLDVQKDLAEVRKRQELHRIQQDLERDYQLLTFVLRHGAAFQFGPDPAERRLLMIDFAVLRCWCGLSRRLSLVNPRPALQEMISILSHFANSMGERVLCRAE